MWHTLVGIKTCHTAAFLPCVSLISVLTLLPGRRSQTAAGVWQTFHFNDVISTCHKTPRLPLISCISIFYFYIYIYPPSNSIPSWFHQPPWGTAAVSEDQGSPRQLTGLRYWGCRYSNENSGEKTSRRASVSSDFCPTQGGDHQPLQRGTDCELFLASKALWLDTRIFPVLLCHEFLSQNFSKKKKKGKKNQKCNWQDVQIWKRIYTLNCFYSATENAFLVSASHLYDTRQLIEHLGELLKTLIPYHLCHFYIIPRGVKLTNATLKPFRVLTTVLFVLGSCTMSSYNAVWMKIREI